MDRCFSVNRIREKQGMALVLVLIIVVISAGLLGAIMYYALSTTEISGLQRKYHTSKEASVGAIDIFTKELVPLVVTQQGVVSLATVVANLTPVPGIVDSVTANSADTCFQSKLRAPTASWTGCAVGAASADPTVSPDITFNLLSAAGTRPFAVQVKIVDTVRGNSNISLPNLGVASGTVPNIPTQTSMPHHPWLYTLTAQGERQGDSGNQERANFEVLYAY